MNNIVLYIARIRTFRYYNVTIIVGISKLYSFRKFHTILVYSLSVRKTVYKVPGVLRMGASRIIYRAGSYVNLI